MTIHVRTFEEMLRYYAKIREAYSNYFSDAFEDDTFSPNEINVLVFLHNNPSINTSKQLTVTLNVSKSLISRSVESLIEKGLLYKEKNPKDGRAELLKLSTNAEPLIAKIEELQNEFAKSLIYNIRPNDLKNWQKVQKQIDENLENSIYTKK